MHEDVYEQVFGNPIDSYRTPKTIIKEGGHYEVPIGPDPYGDNVQWAIISDIIMHPEEPQMLRTRMLILESSVYQEAEWDNPDYWSKNSEIVDIPEGQEISFANSLVDESDDGHWSRKSKLIAGATAASLVTIGGILVARRMHNRRTP